MKEKTAVEWLVEQIKNNVHNTIEEFELIVEQAMETKEVFGLVCLLCIFWIMASIVRDKIKEVDDDFNEKLKNRIK